MRTQVGIIGAGPAGLMLARLLHLAGISSIIIENRDEAYIYNRIRAGLIEHWAADLLTDVGVGDRMKRDGVLHWGNYIGVNGELHHMDFKALVGKRVTIYGQQEVVKDLVAQRRADGGELMFEVSDVSVHNLTSAKPSIRFTHQGRAETIDCDIVAGCDGFHGICRPSIPTDRMRIFEREYPFGWLGILAEVAPSVDELVYTHHPRGFALLSLRSPELSRYYIQCDPDEDADAWSDDAIWAELRERTALEGWQLEEGPILEKGVTGMRSFVAEPMQHGRLFLVGDAAHIVPPTGAKGLNLAVADARTLAEGLIEWYGGEGDAGLRSYSKTCLRRVWRAEHFSYWMTTMLHKQSDDPFEQRLQLSQLRYVTSSQAAAASLAENYVGLTTMG